MRNVTLARMSRSARDALHRQDKKGPRRNRRGAAACAFAVLVATICGCGSTTTAGTAGLQSAASTTAPTAIAATRVALHLDAGSYSLSAPNTRISGTATPGASVVVNGRPVSVHSGRWSRAMALHLGRNRVTVVASVHGGPSVHRSIRVTRRRSTAELEARATARALRAEADRRKAVAAEGREAAQESPTCTNGTYVNSAGNTVCSPERSSTAPAGATAECGDGTYSFSESRSGTCSSHEGVAKWL
jgi:hypothetical protein